MVTVCKDAAWCRDLAGIVFVARDVPCCAACYLYIRERFTNQLM